MKLTEQLFEKYLRLRAWLRFASAGMAGAGALLTGHLEVLHHRGGRLIGVYRCHNGTTTGGCTYLLGAGVGGSTQITAWYLTPIDNLSFSALSTGDTPSSHAGWVECQNYNETVRQAWTPAAAAGASITNSASPAVFTFTAAKTIRGFALFSSSTKGGTGGTLYSTALLQSSQDVEINDTLTVIYRNFLTPG